MKITKIFSLFLIGLFSVMLLSDIASAQSAPTVRVTGPKKTLRQGGTSFVTIKFVTGPKVKVPKEPPIEVSLTGEGITGTGVQDYSGGEGDYISGSQIKYNFKVNSDAPSGNITVNGTVKFPYCSTETGTCKITTKSFSFTVKVK